MKAASAALLVLLGQDPVCDHGTRGAARPVDLREVARLHRDSARAFELSVDRPSRVTLPGFDSGLPSCRRRQTRTVRVESLPPDLKPLYFATAGSEIPADSILVATKARSVSDAPLLATTEVAARFGVRCVPTRVRPVGPADVELEEGAAR